MNLQGAIYRALNSRRAPRAGPIAAIRPRPPRCGGTRKPYQALWARASPLAGFGVQVYAPPPACRSIMIAAWFLDPGRDRLRPIRWRRWRRRRRPWRPRRRRRAGHVGRRRGEEEEGRGVEHHHEPRTSRQEERRPLSLCEGALRRRRYVEFKDPARPSAAGVGYTARSRPVVGLFLRLQGSHHGEDGAAVRPRRGPVASGSSKDYQYWVA